MVSGIFNLCHEFCLREHLMRGIGEIMWLVLTARRVNSNRHIIRNRFKPFLKSVFRKERKKLKIVAVSSTSSLVLVSFILE